MVIKSGGGGADDKAETDHLLALAAGAGEGRLSVFRCDLLDGAARGCSGVFHLASPCTGLTCYVCLRLQNQLMVPAVKNEGNFGVWVGALVRSFVLQVPQGYPAWAGESGGNDFNLLYILSIFYSDHHHQSQQLWRPSGTYVHHT